MFFFSERKITTWEDPRLQKLSGPVSIRLNEYTYVIFLKCAQI